MKNFSMKKKKVITSLLLTGLVMNLLTACGTNNSITQGKNDAAANDNTADVPVRNDADNRNDHAAAPGTANSNGSTADNAHINNGTDGNSVMDDAGDAVNNIADDVGDTVSNAADDVADGVKDIADGAKDTVDDLAGSNKTAKNSTR